MVLLAIVLFTQRRTDASFRRAVHIDAFCFHFLQVVAILVFGEIDVSQVGSLQFIGAHAACATMFAVARDSTSYDAKSKTA